MKEETGEFLSQRVAQKEEGEKDMKEPKEKKQKVYHKE